MNLLQALFIAVTGMIAQRIKNSSRWAKLSILSLLAILISYAWYILFVCLNLLCYNTPMKMKAILICLMLAGCGDHTKITYHEVSQETLAEISGDPKALGWTIWDDKKYEVLCDIYLLPYDSYIDQQCFDAVVLHEKKHCYEFNFHSERYTFPECE